MMLSLVCTVCREKGVANQKWLAEFFANTSFAQIKNQNSPCEKAVTLWLLLAVLLTQKGGSVEGEQSLLIMY